MISYFLVSLGSGFLFLIWFVFGRANFIYSGTIIVIIFVRFFFLGFNFVYAILVFFLVQLQVKIELLSA